jgi:AcrR family transcriptional regulator
MTLKTSTPSRGRPRDPKKLESIVQTAKQLFSEHGFERISVDEIARQAGVTKATVYSYFGSKEALFGATVLHKVREEFALGEGQTLDPRSPEEGLQVIGKQFLSLIRRDDVLGAHRTLFSCAGVHPDLCEAFFRSAPFMVHAEVTRFFEACIEIGSMKNAIAADAADQFLSLHLGIGHIKAMLGLGKPDPAEDDRLVQRNINLIKQAYDLKSLPA